MAEIAPNRVFVFAIRFAAAPIIVVICACVAAIPYGVLARSSSGSITIWRPQAEATHQYSPCR